MDKIDFGKVGVLLGGHSAEREISLMSGHAVLDALLKKGIDAHPFDPGVSSLAELVEKKFDRVFIALHGRYGEDGCIQGILEQLGIPYTGSGVLASAITMDKVMTKRLWLASGLPTPPFVLLEEESDFSKIAAYLGLPLIVKPVHEGSTLGLTKVTEVSQLPAAYRLAARYDNDVIAEAFIDGIELTCAVLGKEEDMRALPLIHIVAPNANYDYQHKYFSDETQYICPADIPEGDASAIQKMVLAAYRTVGCRGWARADVMVRHSDNQPFLIEINGSPGMTSHSLVPTAAKSIGIDFAQLCVDILNMAALDAPISLNK